MSFIRKVVLPCSSKRPHLQKSRWQMQLAGGQKLVRQKNFIFPNNHSWLLENQDLQSHLRFKKSAEGKGGGGMCSSDTRTPRGW